MRRTARQRYIDSARKAGASEETIQLTLAERERWEKEKKMLPPPDMTIPVYEDEEPTFNPTTGSRRNR